MLSAKTEKSKPPTPKLLQLKVPLEVDSKVQENKYPVSFITAAILSTL
jgi:hypothetical protein